MDVTDAFEPIQRLRPATEEDVPRLVEMGQRFRRESKYADRLTENPTQMATIGRHLVTQPNGLLLVAEREGRLVGMIGMLVFPHHLSGEPTAGEIFFWVEPEFRGCGIRLMAQAEAWARAQGATTMQMIAPTERVGRFYERLGYAALEVAYEKVLTPKESPLCP